MVDIMDLRFHTNTTQFCQARLVKAPYRNKDSQHQVIHVFKIRVVCISLSTKYHDSLRALPLVLFQINKWS